MVRSLAEWLVVKVGFGMTAIWIGIPEADGPPACRWRVPPGLHRGLEWLCRRGAQSHLVWLRSESNQMCCANQVGEDRGRAGGTFKNRRRSRSHRGNEAELIAAQNP